ncbi:unnamed protein product, partial [marine sediment metagenome]
SKRSSFDKITERNKMSVWIVLFIAYSIIIALGIGII